MLLEYLTAVGLIFVAEMGDKTQILAMAFATKYKVRDVLLGIMVGSFLNHGLAVILGSALSTVVPVETLQIIAGVSFVGFALWTLRLDEDEEENSSRKNYGALFTVALAFFIGELGDKTQLTAIVLSTDANYPFLILLGTVTGMVITGGLGIFVGSKLGAKIPEFTIKMVSATIFMIFGIIKLLEYLPSEFITTFNIIVFIVLIAILASIIIRPTLNARKSGQVLLKTQAQKLQDFYKNMIGDVEDICLGTEICGECQSINCVIGATKELLKHNIENFELDYDTLNKKFNNMKIITSLKKILDYIQENESTRTINITKKHLEMILFGQEIEFVNIEDYLKRIKEIDLLAYKLLQ